ncbi:MAG: hypothetical protein KatS3mg015_1212 [Fimbriimonadales bacterium]|nr:MAG: hypothetical protein KatS3mg015_1212 [Fimbriimonadales bacterium]
MFWLPAACVLAFAPATSHPSVEAREVTVRSLLAEMTDLDRLMQMPEPSYRTAQSSSYDRASKSPAEGWFANQDYGHFLRVERKPGRNEYVMADLKGPGAVMRIWSPNPQGTLRFYFDGEDLPELIVPMKELLSGGHPDFPPPFSGMRAAAGTLYYPFPYAKRLVITVDDRDADPSNLYYHIQYRTYEPPTPVRTFTLAQAKDAALLAERVGRNLQDPHVFQSVRDRTLSQQYILAPGQVAAMRMPDGSGVVRQLSVWVQAYEPDEDAPDGLGDTVAPEVALRGVLLEASFDGKRTISAPVGDFFGGAPGFLPHESLPFSVNETTAFMTCRFPMPQRETSTLFFTNHTEKRVLVSVEARWRSEVWTAGPPLYFHAKWKRETLATRPMRDWTILDTAGTGRFVGLSLSVLNPVSTWWGEGDEKIFVDEDEFPSIFGTGTEDYFGYGWGSPALFQHPYYGQLRCDGPGNRGFTSVYRFQTWDDVPFRKRLRFDLEVWHWRETEIDYAAVAYWYASPDSKDTFPPIRPSQLVLPLLPETWRRANAIEGESLTADPTPAGTLEVQSLDDRWSDGKQLWWRDAQPGSRLVLRVPSEKQGKRRLVLGVTKARDYGIVRIRWNGVPIGDPLDLYSPRLEPAELALGEVEVRAENLLEVEILGMNPSAEPKRHMFGLDYLVLEEQR